MRRTITGPSSEDYSLGVSSSSISTDHVTGFLNALNECKDHRELATLLTKVDEGFALKIFITSRIGPDKKHLGSLVLEESVPREATMYDIRLYVQFYMDDFAIRAGTGRQQLVDTILQKSAGCFLWVLLVIERLSKVHDSDDIQIGLDNASKGMKSLYKENARSLGHCALRQTASEGNPSIDCLVHPSNDNARARACSSTRP